MPSDVLGCTRNTIAMCWKEWYSCGGTGGCKGATNEEFLVTAAH